MICLRDGRCRQLLRVVLETRVRVYRSWNRPSVHNFLVDVHGAETETKMRSGQFVGRLILGNVNHGAPGGQGVVGSIDADLIRSQLLEISSMVRRPWWYQWCLPVHDFLRDVAEGMGMVLKDDTISDP